MTSIVSRLRASPKGQLLYERDQNIKKEYFDKYLSPPKLSKHHIEVSTESSFCSEDDDFEEFNGTLESDTFESLKNIKVEIENRNVNSNKEAENFHQKGNMKIQFNSDKPNQRKNMTVQVLNKGADVLSYVTKNSLDNFSVTVNNDHCNTYKKKKGRLEEKTLNRPSPDVAESPRIMVSPKYSKSSRDIEDYKEDLNNKTTVEFERKRHQFKEAQRKIDKRAKKQIDEYENKQQEKAVHLQRRMEQQEKQGSAELLKTQMKMIQDHILHAKMLEKKHERIHEEMKKKEAERLQLWENAKTIVGDSKTTLDKVKTLFNSYASKVPEGVTKAVHLAQQKYSASQQIVSADDSTAQISNQQLVTISENFRFLSNTYDFVKQSIHEIKEREKKEALEAQEKAEQEARKKAEEEARKKRETPAASAVHPGQPGATGGTSATPSTPVLSTPQVTPKEGEVLCVDLRAFQDYSNLQQKLKDEEAAIQVLSSTPQLKKMKFAFQKAVNIPVNAISAVSGAHLRDKLQRLLVLLSGQQVEITNSKISVQEHPAALRFCKYLFAKMVVKKGEEQVSSIFESAFPLAAVTVGVLADHPDIRDLLLAHFHSMCPYIVPYHIPRQEQQSTEEYHKALGYKYDSDGNVEKQDKFLKRMSGIMRLYASIMVSFPPRRQSTHPFGIEHAWIWLSRVMNIQPLPDVTATMVFDLLEVTGHALYKEYRKQFLKMLHILIREFLPKLKAVASSGGGGPVSRLEALIKSSIQRQGQIQPPEGILYPNFWFS